MHNLKITISALDVAKYFLFKANSEGDLITNLKMQKLLYYAQAWYLVNFNAPLFKETIKAWALGPVIREVYNEFKIFGASPIEYKHTGKEVKIFTEEQRNYLNEFYDVFFKFNAHELVNMTHNEKPWMDAYKNKTDISRQSMKSYYSSVLKASRKNGKKAH